VTNSASAYTSYASAVLAVIGMSVHPFGLVFHHKDANQKTDIEGADVTCWDTWCIIAQLA